MEFDQYAEQYDAGFMGKGSTRFYRDLIRELEIRDGNAVLDVGCGTGTILEWIGKSKKIHGYGLDVSESMIAVAREKNPDYSFVTGDSALLPYADESMDVIMACMAYHHFPEGSLAGAETRRITLHLRPEIPCSCPLDPQYVFQGCRIPYDRREHQSV